MLEFGQETLILPIDLKRAIKAGRVWTNCYHDYPAHAAFGGYKQSGIGREKPFNDVKSLSTNKEFISKLQSKKLGFN